MSLLTLEKIVKLYGTKVVLDGVDLKVHQGERLALIGPNGSGKSTLIRIAMGHETPDSGRIFVAGGAKVGYLSQNLLDLDTSESLNRTAVEYEKVIKMEQRLREMERQMAEGSEEAEELDALMNRYSRLIDEYESIGGYAVGSKIRGILLGLGLREEALSIPVRLLSGGEKMRVALARILLEEPDLLLLDEPTNHLDIKAVEWLEEFLSKFSGGVLIVSHDRYFLDRVATRVAELEGGKISERSGNYSTYMEQKAIRKEFLIKEQRRLEREIKETGLLVDKLKGMRRISAARSREKMKERLEKELSEQLERVRSDEHLSQRGRPKLYFAEAKHLSSEIARVDKLRKSFGDLVLFSGASFVIRGGERVGIIGPNGSGKTTLLNILLGHDTDYQGFVRLGSWVRYGYIGQDAAFEDEERTIAEEITAKREMKDKELHNFLARFHFFGDDIHKKIKVLSGGERIRLRLASIMLDEPYCLIMDEPTNHLDVPAREALELALQEFNGTVIAVSHDRYFLNQCVDKILAIEDGLIVRYEGNYEYYKEVKAGQRTPYSMPDGKEASGQKGKGGSGRNGKGSSAKGKRSDAPRGSEGTDGGGSDVDPKALEDEIIRLEELIGEMEGTFNEETSYERFREYGELVERLNGLYEIWEKIAE